MKVYVASSWRNDIQPIVVTTLRAMGFDVYDFRDEDGFDWSEVDPTVEVAGFEGETRARTFLQMLDSPQAQRGFARDMKSLEEADVVICVLPCGRSAHLELGHAAGAGKRTFVLLDDPCRPELMYRMLEGVLPSITDLIFKFGEIAREEGIYPIPNAVVKGVTS